MSNPFTRVSKPAEFSTLFDTDPPKPTPKPRPAPQPRRDPDHDLLVEAAAILARVARMKMSWNRTQLGPDCLRILRKIDPDRADEIAAWVQAGD